MNSDLLEGFSRDCRMRNIKNIQPYKVYIKQYLELLSSRSKDANSADKGDLMDFLSSLRQRGLKQASIEKAFTALSSFYTYMVDEELISNNPITSFKRRYLRKYKDENTSEDRQIISVEQASLLVNSTLNSRDKAVLVILLKTGMRRGELCSLDVSDIDFKNMALKLKSTSKRSNRVLFFDSEAEYVLRAWLQFRNRKDKRGTPALFLGQFGGRISSREISHIVTKHASRVGLHDSESKCLEHRFTPHCCRHWFTTHLIRAGMPRDFVKELRGDVRHEAIDIYNHIDKKELKESYMAHIPQLGI
ncbi:MAG: tyrosine-type recombinase/integrase [Methanotrichaceae archaeon]|jgi:integrase/recombinase XerD